jgi:hypothetical protein
VLRQVYENLPIASFAVASMRTNGCAAVSGFTAGDVMSNDDPPSSAIVSAASWPVPTPPGIPTFEAVAGNAGSVS